MAGSQTSRIDLEALLSIALILHKITTQLPFPSLIALMLTSRTLANLILHTPSTHRTITIPETNRAKDFHRLFTLPRFQRDTQILRLEDRLTPNLESLAEALLRLPHRVRILDLTSQTTTSIVRILTVLLHELPPISTLKAIYMFSHESPAGALARRYSSDVHGQFRFVELVNLAAEKGVLMDAQVCSGGLHNEDWEFALPPSLASVHLRKPCAGCHKEEGTDDMVLKLPVPVESADLHAACLPSHLRELEGGKSSTKGSYRCEACCEGRRCSRCGKWWCEECFPGFREPQLLRRTRGGGSMFGRDNIKDVMGVWLGCDQCGALCGECELKVTDRCGRCRMEFCGVHEKAGGSRAKSDYPIGLCHDCWR